MDSHRILPFRYAISLRPDYLLAKAAQLLLVILTVAHIFNKPADPALTHHDHNNTADDTHPYAIGIYGIIARSAANQIYGSDECKDK